MSNWKSIEHDGRPKENGTYVTCSGNKKIISEYIWSLDERDLDFSQDYYCKIYIPKFDYKEPEPEKELTTTEALGIMFKGGKVKRKHETFHYYINNNRIFMDPGPELWGVVDVSAESFSDTKHPWIEVKE